MQSHSLSSLYSVSLEDQVLRVSSSRDGAQVAVGTSNSCFVLDAKTGNRDFQTTSGQGPVTALAFTSDKLLLVGARGILRLWDFEVGKVLASLELSAKLEKTKDKGDEVFIAAQPQGDLFAVASEHGRKVYIVNHNLVIQRELHLLNSCGSLSELSWLSSSALLATTVGGIQGWRLSCSSNQPSLILGRSIGLISALASSDHSTLAAGSRDGVVYLWSVMEGDQQQGDEPLYAELRSTLKDYNDEVHLLRWDCAGRYLATMDGSETTIWDVPRLFQQPVQSNICCGHDPQSQILCAAFQEDGHVLASGGSDGKVLFYNSLSFQPGQVSQPCAAAQCLPPGDGVTCLKWLPGGHLVAGTKSGKVIGWQVMPSAFDTEATAPAGERAVAELEASGKALQIEQPHLEAPANGFSKRGQQQKPAQKGARPDPPGTSSNNHAASRLPSRGSGRISRETSSGREPSSGSSGALERHISLPNTRSSRELADKLRGEAAPASNDSPSELGDGSRSNSLQDTSSQGLGRRTTSLERQQLSPSLMQHIQRVQQKPTSSNRQREPAGWGMGSPGAAASPTSSQMPYGGSGGVIPFNTAHMPGAMQPGSYMMISNQAGMGPQGMLPFGGFQPAMAPMPPMMAPNPSAPHQGMVGNSSLPPGMVYLPVGASAVPQQQWQMLPWMTPYILHPGQQVPEHLNIQAAGRSSSAPEGPLAFSWAARPVQTSGPAGAPSLPCSDAEAASAPPGSFQEQGREYPVKSALSLPSAFDADWRNRGQPVRGTSDKDAQQTSAPTSEAAAAPTPGTLKKRASLSQSEAATAAPVSPLGAAGRDSREARDGRQSHAANHGGLEINTPAWLPHPAPPRPTLSGPSPDAIPVEEEVGNIDPSNPVVTVYVGNLPPTVDEVALMVPFSYYGSITNIQVIRDKNSLQSRGFAFVSYSQPESATAAIQNMNGRILYGSFRGRALKVGPSNRII